MANIKKDNQGMDFPLQIARQYPAPLDKHSVFYSLAEAEEYSKNSPLAYVGQTISVLNESDRTVEIYKIGFDGELLGLGGEVDTSELVKKSGDTMTGSLKVNKELVVDNTLYTPSHGAGTVRAFEIKVTYPSIGGMFGGVYTPQVIFENSDIGTSKGQIFIDSDDGLVLSSDTKTTIHTDLICRSRIFGKEGVYDYSDAAGDQRVYSPINLPPLDIIGAAPRKHSIKTSEYGVGTTIEYGHVQLSNIKTVNSTFNGHSTAAIGSALAYGYHAPSSSGIDLNNYRSPGQFTLYFSSSSYPHTNFPTEWNSSRYYYLEVKNGYSTDNGIIQILYCPEFDYAYTRRYFSSGASAPAWTTWSKSGTQGPMGGIQLLADAVQGAGHMGVTTYLDGSTVTDNQNGKLCLCLRNIGNNYSKGDIVRISGKSPESAEYDGDILGNICGPKGDTGAQGPAGPSYGMIKSYPISSGGITVTTTTIEETGIYNHYVTIIYSVRKVNGFFHFTYVDGDPSDLTKSYVLEMLSQFENYAPMACSGYFDEGDGVFRPVTSLKKGPNSDTFEVNYLY